MKILLATRNPGKIKEINRLFQEIDTEFVGLDSFNDLPDVVEDGDTYRANALKKATAYHQLSDMPTLAEDSGLETDALNGAPGIFSARFAGKNADDNANIRKLLELIKDIPADERTARFVSVLCLIIDEKRYFFEGEVRGRLLNSPHGNSGFGYDPVFVPDGYEMTFAELGQEIKNSISHRSQSIKKLKYFLRDYARSAGL